MPPCLSCVLIIFNISLSLLVNFSYCEFIIMLVRYSHQFFYRFCCCSRRWGCVVEQIYTLKPIPSALLSNVFVFNSSYPNYLLFSYYTYRLLLSIGVNYFFWPLDMLISSAALHRFIHTPIPLRYLNSVSNRMTLIQPLKFA